MKTFITLLITLINVTFGVRLDADKAHHAASFDFLDSTDFSVEQYIGHSIKK